MAATPPPDKVIYSMIGVSKKIDKKVLLKDIYLSYFYGAKIGVLGVNGAGKSTLLKILAGVDKEFDGRRSPSPRATTTGFLEQEPKLDPDRTVREIVQEGVQSTLDLIREFEDLSARFAEPMSDDQMNKLLEKQGTLRQEKLDAINAWELDQQLPDMAMDAAQHCPPPDMERRQPSPAARSAASPSAAYSSKNPTSSSSTNPPTISTPNPSNGWKEHLRRYAGTVIAVTHDRYFLDNVAGWILELDRGAGIPFKGNYTSWLEQKSTRMKIEEKQESQRQRALALPSIRVGPLQPLRPPRFKSKARLAAYDQMVSENAEKKAHGNRNLHPARPARLGLQSHRGRRHFQRPTATNSSSTTSPSHSLPAASSASSDPTAPAKPPSSA